jgi:threonine dehydratase
MRSANLLLFGNVGFRENESVAIKIRVIRGSATSANGYSSMSLALSTVNEAKALLSRCLPVSRLVAARSLTSGDCNVYLKLETDLPTGSFKPRGALWALSVNIAKRQVAEVVASSTGNHGAAVAYAAKTLGVSCTIFLPRNPNPTKREKIAALGAKIVECGGPDLASAFVAARDYAERDGVYFLNDATDPDLPAGPATIALEIFEQKPETAAIYVPMGDTALIRGVAAVAKQLSSGVRIVGVQAERAPSYFLSWRDGRAIPTETCDTIADGLATRTPEEENVRAIRELVDDVVLVSEEEMLGAIRHLNQEEGVLAEPAGAAATAAFLKSTFGMDLEVVLLVSGANISPEVHRSALAATN